VNRWLLETQWAHRMACFCTLLLMELVMCLSVTYWAWPWFTKLMAAFVFYMGTFGAFRTWENY
jgi:antibiotic biosynthesis monooxygenase (ABM) superfamily enzyme